MPSWTRKTVAPGDRVTVEVQHSYRAALRPLIGLLRTVEVIEGGRALIFNEDGTRYAVNGRALPPVALVEVSIFGDPATGGLWAQVYDLPPRERGPYLVDPRYAPVAEPDGAGGIARMRSCWCGRGCVCPTCGEQLIKIPTKSGLEWSARSLVGGTHSARWCAASSCASTETPSRSDGPDCCAMPMMLAPVAWVCRRESAHRRPYLWSAAEPAAVVGMVNGRGEEAPLPTRGVRPVGMARLRDPRFRTLDGVLVVDGLRVWDYDLQSGTVCISESRIDSEYWDGWFAILRDDGSRQAMNGERLWTLHPVSRRPPPPFTDERATQLRAALRTGARLIVDFDPQRRTCPVIAWKPRVPSDPQPWLDTVSGWRYRSSDVRPSMCDYCDQPATRKVCDATDEFVCTSCARDQFTDWREATSPLSQRHVSDRFTGR